MEDYINKMTMTSIKVKKAGLKIYDEIVGSLMLAGLPYKYKPLVMAVENLGSKLSSDAIKPRLLQEVKYDKENSETSKALISKSKGRTSHKKSLKCFECNQSRHFAKNYAKKKSFNDNSSKNEKKLHMSFVAKDIPSDEWYIDSGASAHMTMNRNSLISRSEPRQTKIIVGNNSRLLAECLGDIKMNIFNDNIYVFLI